MEREHGGIRYGWGVLNQVKRQTWNRGHVKKRKEAVLAQ